MTRPSSLLAWSAAAIATLILPWHMQQDGLTLAALFGFGQEDAEAASALWQAMAHHRFWFWPVVAALVVTLPGAPRRRASQSARSAAGCRSGSASR